jgi:hypothetical protein
MPGSTKSCETLPPSEHLLFTDGDVLVDRSTSLVKSLFEISVFQTLGIGGVAQPVVSELVEAQTVRFKGKSVVN